MSTFEITTASSIWTFDFDSMIVTRMPKTDEGGFKGHPLLDYQTIGKPQPFNSIQPEHHEGEGTCYWVMTDQGPFRTGLAESIEGEIPDQHLSKL